MTAKTSRHSARRAFAAGFLVTIAGPPLGASAVLLLAVLDKPNPLVNFPDLARDFMIFVQIAIPFSYIIGGIPALIAGIIIGMGIYKKGWIAWRHWIGLAALLGFLTEIFIDVIENESLTLGLPVRALMYMIPAVFAATILRLLIVSFGWMRRPDAPARPA